MLTRENVEDLLVTCKSAFKREEKIAEELAIACGLGVSEWETFLNPIGIALNNLIIVIENEIQESEV